MTVSASPGLSQLLVGVEGCPHFGGTDAAVQCSLPISVPLSHIGSTRQKQPENGKCLNYKSVQDKVRRGQRF